MPPMMQYLKAYISMCLIMLSLPSTKREDLCVYSDGRCAIV